MTDVCPPLSMALPAVMSSRRGGRRPVPCPAVGPSGCSGPRRIKAKGPCGTNILGAGGGPQAVGAGAGQGEVGEKGPQGPALPTQPGTPTGRQLPKGCPLFHATAWRQMGSQRQTANIFPNTLTALGVDVTPAYKLGMLSPHSWAPVPGTSICPGPKETQMFVPLAGPGAEGRDAARRTQACHGLRNA